MKKLKSFLLITCFSFVLTPLAMAESAEDLFNQGIKSQDKGDYAQAAKLFEKVCQMGSANACFNLGHLYLDGQGVKQNKTHAAKLYEKACNGGNTKSCFNLGNAYFNGQVSNKTIQKPLNYMKKVAIAVM